MFKNNYAILPRYVWITSFLLFFVLVGLSSPAFATNYYVDRDASGNGSGTSWANASKTVHGLPWSSIQSGDTVYVSGGTDSTLYPKDFITNKSVSGGYIVVTKGNDPNHSGAVWFANSDPGSLGYSFNIDNCHNIKVTGLNFTTRIDTTIYAQYIVETSGYNHNVIIDNCHIVSPGNAIGLGGAHDIGLVVSNCTIEILSNDSDLGQDPIVYGLGSEYQFLHNIIIHRQIGGIDGQGNHGDLLQLAQTGDTGWDNRLLQIIFSRQFFLIIQLM